MNMNATAQMVTTTQVGCTRINWRKLYEQSEKAGQEIIKMHREAVDTCNKEREKLTEARKLLFAVQPFCEAWAAFDLADDIEDFLNGKPRKKRKEANGKRNGKGPHNVSGTEVPKV
jgi:hypothetical protein